MSNVPPEVEWWTKRVEGDLRTIRRCIQWITGVAVAWGAALALAVLSGVANSGY